MGTGCMGCLAVAGLLVLAGSGLFVLKPRLYERGADWVLYEPPPREAAVDPAGAQQTERFFREVVALAARGNRLTGRAELNERQVNGYLQEVLQRRKDFEGIKKVEVSFLDDRIDLFAAINPAEMEHSAELREFAQSIPEIMRDRRMSLRITLGQSRVENGRLTFEKVSGELGRIPVPFSARYFRPWLNILPGGAVTADAVASGIPIPPRTKVKIAPTRIEVTPVR